VYACACACVCDMTHSYACQDSFVCRMSLALNWKGGCLCVCGNDSFMHVVQTEWDHDSCHTCDSDLLGSQWLSGIMMSFTHVTQTYILRLRLIGIMTAVTHVTWTNWDPNDLLGSLRLSHMWLGPTRIPMTYWDHDGCHICDLDLLGSQWLIGIMTAVTHVIWTYWDPSDLLGSWRLSHRQLELQCHVKHRDDMIPCVTWLYVWHDSTCEVVTRRYDVTWWNDCHTSLPIGIPRLLHSLSCHVRWHDDMTVTWLYYT